MGTPIMMLLAMWTQPLKLIGTGMIRYEGRVSCCCGAVCILVWCCCVRVAHGHVAVYLLVSFTDKNIFFSLLAGAIYHLCSGSSHGLCTTESLCFE